jgi:hypothetical protein
MGINKGEDGSSEAATTPTTTAAVKAVTASMAVEFDGGGES